MRSVLLSLLLFCAVVGGVLFCTFAPKAPLDRLCASVEALDPTQASTSADCEQLLLRWEGLCRRLTVSVSKQRLEPITELFQRLCAQSETANSDDFLQTKRLLCHRLTALRDAEGFSLSSLLFQKSAQDPSNRL